MICEKLIPLQHCVYNILSLYCSELTNLYPSVIRAPSNAASTNYTDLTRKSCRTYPNFQLIMSFSSIQNTVFGSRGKLVNSLHAFSHSEFLGEGRRVICNITLSNTNSRDMPPETFMEWWSLHCDHPNFTNLFTSSSLDMYIYSDPVAQALFGSIATIG